jgi:hypothetical protein
VAEVGEVACLQAAVSLFVQREGRGDPVQHPERLHLRGQSGRGADRRGHPLHERSLADYERVLGPDHPDTAITRSNLASAYESAKQASSSGDRGRANG